MRRKGNVFRWTGDKWVPVWKREGESGDSDVLGAPRRMLLFSSTTSGGNWEPGTDDLTGATGWGTITRWGYGSSYGTTEWWEPRVEVADNGTEFLLMAITYRGIIRSSSTGFSGVGNSTGEWNATNAFRWCGYQRVGGLTVLVGDRSNNIGTTRPIIVHSETFDGDFSNFPGWGAFEEQPAIPGGFASGEPRYLKHKNGIWTMANRRDLMIADNPNFNGASVIARPTGLQEVRCTLSEGGIDDMTYVVGSGGDVSVINPETGAWDVLRSGDADDTTMGRPASNGSVLVIGDASSSHPHRFLVWDGSDWTALGIDQFTGDPAWTFSNGSVAFNPNGGFIAQVVRTDPSSETRVLYSPDGYNWSLSEEVWHLTSNSIPI